jgi:hypothetical protein
LRAKAFNLRVVFYDPYLPNGVELALGIDRAASLEELLRQTDTLSIHTPLTPETRGLLGHAAGARIVRRSAGTASLLKEAARAFIASALPPIGQHPSVEGPCSFRNPASTLQSRGRRCRRHARRLAGLSVGSNLPVPGEAEKV